MFQKLIRFFVPSKNTKLIKRFQPIVARINALEPDYEGLADSDFPKKTAEFKKRVAEGETLDEILPEAFACAREVSRRINQERHFDVQLVGGIAMHTGRIAEMKTGEGKTLSSTAPAYLNALSGKGVHIVTPNDYLAKRDSAWMGKIYQALGLNVGLIQHGMDDDERREAYQADVTYGTNNEFGFDYLRDNMKFEVSDFVQRPFNYAIVDEVDSILIDEARTPLIISGPTEDSIDKYYLIEKVMHGLEREIKKEEVLQLTPAEAEGVDPNWQDTEERTVVREGDYSMDEKSRTITLSEKGSQLMEQRLKKENLLPKGNLFDFENIDILHYVNQALKANYLFKRDVDYVVAEDKVVIVDEFTGRLMPGRRFSDGLHQALEAKESVQIEKESQTYATITFQNYFRMYEKLAGMTGTAKTEEEEFIKIYNMEVAEVPTNREMVRDDQADMIYKNHKAKLDAVAKDVGIIHKTGQPVLVGTASIESSEEVSRLLKKNNIPHNVLNAKFHEQEAEIITGAGEKNRVTIATNMAGRGTDIKLGEGVKELGGLFIIGTERHESRRIDNQLRGRAGRQGDPGGSRFYLSLEDDLMRIFGGDRISGLMTRLKVADDEAITHPWITKAIENAQKKVEGHNFEIRKHVLEYDDVMNKQREIVYGQRKEILSPEISRILMDMAGESIDEMIDIHLEAKHSDQWDTEGFITQFNATFGLDPDLDWEDTHISLDPMAEALMTQVENLYHTKKAELKNMMHSSEREEPTPEHLNLVFSDFQRQVVLGINDNLWKDHLLSMDHLREGISLVGYAQKKPIDEYKKAGYEMFSDLMLRISRESTVTFFRAHFSGEAPAPRKEQAEQELDFVHGEAPSKPREPVKKEPRLGRNDPCHCNSGKKYKNCHLRLEQDSSGAVISG